MESNKNIITLWALVLVLTASHQSLVGSSGLLGEYDDLTVPVASSLPPAMSLRRSSLEQKHGAFHLPPLFSPESPVLEAVASFEALPSRHGLLVPLDLSVLSVQGKSVPVRQVPVFSGGSTLLDCVVPFLEEDTPPVCASSAKEAEVEEEKSQFSGVDNFVQGFFKSCPEFIFDLFGTSGSQKEQVRQYAERRLAPGNYFVHPAEWHNQIELYMNMALREATEPSAWRDRAIPGIIPNKMPSWAMTTEPYDELCHTHMPDWEFFKRTEAFVEKKMIRRAGAPGQTVLFMGDLHGSAHALARNLLLMKKLGYLQDDFTMASNVHLVFLGDLTDRGLYGIESVYTVLRLKNANWGQVHIVRGNHESGKFVDKYGFFAELDCKYASTPDDVFKFKLDYALFCSTLPSTLFLGFYDDESGSVRYMQCSHGGIVPHHDPRPLLQGAESVCYEKITYSMPDYGEQYEWNDVCCRKKDECLIGKDDSQVAAYTGEWKLSPRGGDVYELHRDDVTKLLRKNGLFMLMRGHQDQIAPCKVLKDGCSDPVSWRVHEAFDAINPINLFRHGINLCDAPNCITLTNATEARALYAECLFGISIEPSLASSRVWLAEIDLLPREEMQKILAFYRANPGATGKVNRMLIAKAEVQREGKFVCYQGLGRGTFIGSAGTGEGAASPPFSDGTIPSMTTWSDDVTKAGIVPEWVNSSPPGGTRRTPKQEEQFIHKPGGDVCPLAFGPGTVRETLSVIPGGK